MKIAAVENIATASAWWAAQRWHYNTILLAGAFASFLCLLGVGWAFEKRLSCLEITALSVAVGGVFFLLGLGMANICYFLGPLLERLLQPKRVLLFRHAVFALGTSFSLSLIFLPVVANIFSAVVGPGMGTVCE